MYYDIYQNRWIIVAADDSRSSSSGILVAASQTDDPTGSWNRYKIDGDVANGQWFDYPGVGINKDWVVITGNMFEYGGSGAGSENKAFVFSKADFYDGVSSLDVSTFVNISTGLTTMMPAVMYDNTIDRIYMLQNWNGGAGTVRLTKIQGTTNPVFAQVGFIGTGNSWSTGTSATNFAPQAGSTTNINNGNARILDAVYRGETGTFWACQNAYLPASSPTRTVAQWMEIDPDADDNGTDGDTDLIQFGRVDGQGADDGDDIFYAYPSIAVNALGDMVIGFTSFSENQFASAGYAVRFNNEPLNTTQDAIDFRAGSGPYVKTFGGSRNRWGDYSMTCIDPNDVNIWTLQEFADTAVGGGDGSGRWGVQWAMVTFDGTVAINTPSTDDNDYCTEESLEVDFTTIGSFGGDNVFSVELSDASGNFSSPTVIGTGSSSPITATIPNTTLAGDAYRIRVTSSNPSLSSESNSQNIAIALPPTVHSSGVSVDNSLVGEMTLSWDIGNGENRLVLIKEGSDFISSDLPVNGTSYSSSSIFGLSTIGPNGAAVVFKGTGNSVRVTNLTVGKTYYIAIVEYSCEPPRYFTDVLPTTSNLITNLEAELKRVIRAYPNPTTEELKIDLGEIKQDIELELIDANGKVIDKRTLDNIKRQCIKCKAMTIRINTYLRSDQTI